MAEGTYWSDIGDEVFAGMGMVGGRLAKEITMQDDSWNQQACEGFADVLTAGAGVGSYVSDGVSAACSATSGAVSEWADEYRRFDNEWWPYG